MLRATVLLKQPLQALYGVASHHVATDVDSLPLAGELVDNGQTFEATAIIGLVKDEIVAPDMVREAGPVH